MRRDETTKSKKERGNIVGIELCPKTESFNQKGWEFANRGIAGKLTDWK
jgi:hypothetical protein